MSFIKSQNKALIMGLTIFLTSIASSVILSSWTDPTQTPPLGNVSEPINVGTSTQSKAGHLVVGGNNGSVADPDLWVYGSVLFGVGSAPMFYFDRITGNVGIGTTTPIYKLHLNASSTSWTARFQNNNGYIDFGPANTSGAHIYTDRPRFFFNKDLVLVGNPSVLSAYSTNNLYLSTNSGTDVRMTILASNGNVGIGTTNPQYRLDVNGDINLPSNNVIRIAGSAGSAGQVLTRTSTGMAWQAPSGGVSFPLLAPLGSASAPSYSFSGDTNTGIFSAGADILSFSTGGTERLRITSTGNVGIGTTGPGSKLDIEGGLYQLELTNPTNDGAVGIVFNEGGSANAARIYHTGDYSTGYLEIEDYSSGWTNTGLVIKQGNVGIGTTNPQYRLDVNGDINLPSNNVIRIAGSAGSAGQVLTRTSTGMAWQAPSGSIGGSGSTNYVPKWTATTTLGSSQIFDNGSGVGIGVTNPLQRLHSANYIRADQGFCIGTNCITSWPSGGDNLGNHIATMDLNMSNKNIINVNKLTLVNGGVIDPVYEIKGKKYATYAPFMVGVKEEITGKGKLEKNGDRYKYVIDFPKLKEGSDLWLWYNIVDFSKDNVEAIATPIGDYASIYYELKGSTLTFYGDKAVEFSFRLTGARKDNINWPTQIK